jgi:hypothetical protein
MEDESCARGGKEMREGGGLLRSFKQPLDLANRRGRVKKKKNRKRKRPGIVLLEHYPTQAKTL